MAVAPVADNRAPVWTHMPVENRRVVITGVGLVTALGNNAADTWEGVRAGRSGVGPLTRCQLPGLAPEIAIAG
ncbi:beta-ketoacyl synthase N-terminal-like domain-containing protein, partial [Longimicrobium sp.]|uniref:beta-ketoacyl synthase N-terminal-like domain-containing protein n=1 Tax=Longimicrobium sp. TaxID=2029185 RepID=UPI0039C8D478